MSKIKLVLLRKLHLTFQTFTAIFWPIEISSSWSVIPICSSFSAVFVSSWLSESLNEPASASFIPSSSTRVISTFNRPHTYKATSNIRVYTITGLLCAFSLVVDRDLLKDTHKWHQIHVISRQQTCFSFFMPQKFFNKPFEFLLYKTNR